MRRLVLAAAVFALAGSPARPQAAPTAPDAELPQIAQALRQTGALAPKAARDALKARAQAGDAAARDLLAALESRDAAVKLGARLASLDASGSLGGRLLELETTLEAARRSDAALAAANGDKSLPPLPNPETPKAPEDEQGWEKAVEVFAGAASAGRFRLPATGVAGEAEYTHAPWKLELGGRGLVTPDAQGLPLEGDLSADLSRQILGPRVRAVVGADWHRDDLMGIQRDSGVHAGLEGDLISSARQTLTLGFGYGLTSERHGDGTSEAHPITLTQLEYDLKLASRLAFQQQFELDQNPRDRGDYEIESVTSLVYKLSKDFALRFAHEFSGRGQPVPGFAPRRNETTFGLVWNLR
jgi:hypothetical protein